MYKLERNPQHMMNKELVENWIINYIIKLNLCPYALQVMEDKTYKMYFGEVLETEKMLNECLLDFSSIGYLQTSFLVFDQELSLDQTIALLEFVEEEIELQERQFQTVLFHPNYLHAGIDNQTPTHYSNRSPWPIIQLIRHETLELFQAHKHSKEILERNTKTLSAVGVKKLKETINELRGKN